MPLSVALNSNGAKAVFKEFDGPNGTGNEVAPIGPLVLTSDNPAVAVVNPDGTITLVGVGTANFTEVDSANQLQGSDVLTVTPAMAKSATLTLVAL